MKILIIGGSYFLGRVFTMIACKQHDLTLVNRGHYSLSDFPVQEFYFDRHDKEQWQQLRNENFDAVVDFCAYQQNDIKTVIDVLQNRISHYIYVSTVDVYQRQTGLIQDENHPLENRHYPGEAGEYIYQKRLLEDELVATCQQYQIACSSIRPGNIYGPFNYAPRESLLIKRIIENKPLFELSDADAQFQMVYVKDVARAILLVIEKKLYDQSFNIISDERIDYHLINQIFKTIQPVTVEPHTIEEAISLQYPLPYPLFKEEQELYSGHKIKTYGFKYTSLKEGLKKTYQALSPLFKK